MKNLHDKLVKIQSELKAPKNQFNAFGKYKYRAAEDILEAVKPLLNAEGVILTISEETAEIGGFLVMTSTATITDGADSISVSSQAGINPQRKGMDIAQSFGASSSYAKKYAIGNLFLLDDTKDVDSNKEQTPTVKSKPLFTEENFKKAIAKKATIEMIEKLYSISAELKESYILALNLAQ